MLTEILLGGADRRMLNGESAHSTCARGASGVEKDPTLHSATKSRFVQDQFFQISSDGCDNLVGARRSSVDSMRFNPVRGGTPRGVKTPDADPDIYPGHSRMGAVETLGWHNFSSNWLFPLFC